MTQEDLHGDAVAVNKFLSADEALQQVDQLPEDQFISLVNSLQFKMGDFNRLVELITSDRKVIKIFATLGLRRLLSFEQGPPIQQTVDRGLVPKLFEFAQDYNSPKLQFEAIWCLTNLASSESRFVMTLVENNAIPILISVMQTSNHIEVKEQAIWCIGNISGDNVRLRDTILEQGAVDIIADLVDQAPAGSTFTRNASWTLANFCKGRPMAKFEYIQRAIPSLTKVLIENDSEEMLTDIAWAFSYASDEGGDWRIELFLECNAVPRLIQLLHHTNITIAVPCLRTLGNILTASDELAERAVQQGVLEELDKMLSHPKRAIRKEVCWSISNVTAGNETLIQKCIDIGLIKNLIQLTMTDASDIRKEAVWALSNATSQGTTDQFRYFVEQGMMQALGTVLQIQDPKVITVALEGINYILKAGQQLISEGGENPYAVVAEQSSLMDTLEGLQFHENQKVYEKAVQILEQHFALEDDNDIMGMLQNTASAATSAASE